MTNQVVEQGVRWYFYFFSSLIYRLWDYYVTGVPRMNE